MNCSIYITVKATRKIVACCIAVLLATGSFAQNLNDPNKTGPLGTEVNTISGNLVIPRTDFLVMARGFLLDVTFHYNSYRYDENTGYGNGWSFMYDIQYNRDTSGNRIVRWGDGREDTYDTIPGGTFTAPRGFFTTLAQYTTGKYLLTEKDGTKFYFDNPVHRKITKIQTAAGPSILFNYTDSLLTSVSNDAGQTITLQYNSGNLVAIVDAIASPSRTFTYSYDEAGNLKDVTDPLDNKYRYSYLVNGPMKKVTDRNGNAADIIYYADYSTREVIGCNKRLSFSYDTLGKKTVVTNHMDNGGTNQETTYEYKRVDDFGWITKMTGNCCGYNLSYEYDNQGNQTKLTDANGQVYKFTYDERGNMLSTTNPLGEIRTYTYSTDFNKVTSYKDPIGSLYTLQYDSHGNLTALITPGNNSYTATYNSNGDITSSSDPKGNTFTYNYDAYGNPVSVTGPNGYTATLNFDARGNLLSYHDGKGNTTTLEYDILDRYKTILDPINNRIEMSYDANGNMTAVHHRRGGTSHINYDASDRIVMITGPTGNQMVAGYDAMDNLTYFKNQGDFESSFYYDTRNRLTGIKDAENNLASAGYDANGNLTSVQLPNGRMFTLTYDAANRLKTLKDDVGSLAKIEYDANRNITSFTNATGAITTATYDSLNRMKSQTDPLGNTSTFEYDKNNNLITVTDRNGRATHYTYDEFNRVKTFTNENGAVITLDHDAEGNISQLKDQNNNITSFTYDSLNRRKTMTFADGSIIRYTYDEESNLVTKQLADGTFISYEYDSLNRMTKKTLPGGQVYTFGYDALNRITSATNATGTVLVTYDGLNRITSETFNGKTIQYGYDTQGRTETTTYPDNSVVLKTFDSRNRITSIKKDGVLLAAYSYNGANQLTAKSFGNGLNTIMQYDFANRLSSISTGNGSVQQKSFTYDAVQNKTEISRLNDPNHAETFTYDNAYRLTGYKRGPSGSPLVTNSYTYDAVGNRVSTNLNGAISNYATNNLNQITGISGAQNVNFTYDIRGNLSFDGFFFKKYDAENRLVTDSSSPTNVIHYAYDAFNRRVKTVVNGDLHTYTYSGTQAIEERNQADQLISSTVFMNFLAPVSIDKNGHRYFYHQDELNSVEALSNENGRLLERYRYDVYGQLSREDSLGNPLTASLTGNKFGFTGQEYDSATNSYRFFYRNYSPQTGVFSQRDLIEYADGTSMYQYVDNNPANGIDVFGLACNDPATTTGPSTLDKTESYGSWVGTGVTVTEMGYNHELAKSLTQEILRNQMLRDMLKNEGRFAEAISMEKTMMQNLNSLRTLEGGEAVTGLGKGISNVGKGLGLLDVGIKGYKLGTAIDDYMTGKGDGYQVTKAGGNLAQSALGLNPIAGAYNLFDFAQEKLLTGQSMNDNAEYAGQYYGEWYAQHENAEYSDEAIEAWQTKNGNYAKWIMARNQMEYRIAQNRKRMGLDDCPPHRGTRRLNHGNKNDKTANMEILGPHDPNEIIGPDGQPNLKWVSVNDRMPYTVLFENDASQATAPAKFVRVTVPVEPKQDPASFQIGNFGFNTTTFNVPTNTSSYYTRLDVRDSLGLFVDVTAGYDPIKGQLFWEFQSIDPITFQVPSDPLKGLLLLQDSTSELNGHGFVTFSVIPRKSALTLDTIGARAAIVFDKNDTIPTNIYTNTIDAFAPTTHLTSTAVHSDNTITLNWSGNDDTGGSGIDYYSIYVSNDGNNFSLLVPKIKGTDTTISFTQGNYCFFVLGTDRTGNTEVLRTTDITCAAVGVALPLTWLYFNGATQGTDNILKWGTASEENTADFRLERSLDGIHFTEIATIPAAGRSSSPRDYTYTDAHIDQLNSIYMYYRIKQVDVNGRFTYSRIVRLSYRSAGIQPSIAYPNPTSGFINVVIGDKSVIGTQALLTDINGKVLQRFTIDNNTQSVDLSKMPNGVYLLVLSNRETLKIIRQ